MVLLSYRGDQIDFEALTEIMLRTFYLRVGIIGVIVFLLMGLILTIVLRKKRKEIEHDIREEYE